MISRHLPVEEREQQRPDVAAVDVGVGHQDDLVVAELLDVEAALADAAAERGDERADLGAREHLVEARALDVQDLALERQDRLKLPVAPLLGRAAGAVALDDVELGLAGIARLAVGELARERRVVELALADDLARLARGLARLGGHDRLLDDLRARSAGSPRRTGRASRTTVVSTMVFTSLDTSLLLVCESKLGSGCLMLMTAVSPSRMSSP